MKGGSDVCIHLVPTLKKVCATTRGHKHYTRMSQKIKAVKIRKRADRFLRHPMEEKMRLLDENGSPPGGK